MTPSLHDRVLRAISILNAEEYSDLLTAAARLLVAVYSLDVVAGHEDPDLALLVADIDNETCVGPDDELPEMPALRSAVKTARSMGKENLADDLEELIAEMEDDSPEFASAGEHQP